METVDIIVIGGGIAGIGAAAWLADGASVVVLEKEDAPGRHSTGRSAAIFIKNYGNQVLRHLNQASAPFFLHPEGIAETSLLSARGELIVASKDQLDDLALYLEDSDGLETITAEEAIEMAPLLRREWVHKAAYEKDAQDIDVDRLLQGCLRQAKSFGARLVTDAAVTALAHDKGIWRVGTEKGEFKAPVIINAAGAWAGQLASLAGIEEAPVLTPLRRSAALVAPPAGMDARGWPLVVSAREDWYVKPEAGKLLISPAEEDPVEPHDAWADDLVLAQGIDRAEKAVALNVRRIEHSWAGLRTFTEDHTPLVGFDKRASGFFWLAGQGGYGIQTSPALSRLAADLCLGREPVLEDEVVRALEPSRFAR